MPASPTKTFFRTIGFSMVVGALATAVSCVKSESMPTALDGLYTEVSPVGNAVTLNFLPTHYMVKHETGSTYYDTFSYYFTTGKINLKPAWTTTDPASAFDFRQLDDTSFLIQNLESTIPEAPETYMQFVKH